MGMGSALVSGENWKKLSIKAFKSLDEIIPFFNLKIKWHF
jgi:hypothetical protein